MMTVSSWLLTIKSAVVVSSGQPFTETVVVAFCEFSYVRHKVSTQMAIFAYLAFLLVLVAPTLQQGGRGGKRDHTYCYGRCDNAYKINANDYRVNECDCNQYNFPGHNNCGRIDHSCIVNSYDQQYNNYVWSYDHKTNSCHKIIVHRRCADSYTPQRNIFQNQPQCVRACEPNRGY